MKDTALTVTTILLRGLGLPSVIVFDFFPLMLIENTITDWYINKFNRDDESYFSNRIAVIEICIIFHIPVSIFICYVTYNLMH